MTMLVDQKTKVTVVAGRGQVADYVILTLAPVLTGTRQDHYDCVKLRLTTEDATRLRDELTQQLVEMEFAHD